jgi:hypothetical protein
MSFTIEEDYSDFDWNTTDEGQQQYDPLPEGWYPVRVTKAEVKTYDGREGPLPTLVLSMKVRDGHEHAGRMVFDRLYLNDKEGNKKRRALVWRRMGVVRKGAAKAAVSEGDLIDRECGVYVTVESYDRKDGTKGLKNEVKWDGYKPIGELGAEDAGAGTAEEPGETLDESGCPF